MRVFAVHDIRRASIALYVELEARDDGARLYLTGPGPEAVEVAPNCEAPCYTRLPLSVARRVAAAIESPLADEMVELESWGDFAALVERVTMGEERDGETVVNGPRR